MDIGTVMHSFSDKFKNCDEKVAGKHLEEIKVLNRPWYFHF